MTFDPAVANCSFNSCRCSDRIRPIKRIVVVDPTESFWILKVIFAFCDPALGLQCDNHSQWIEFRTVVGEWQAGFSAIAQRLLVYWHVGDLVAETSQQLSLRKDVEG
jgi:hypothetical protein